VNKYESQYASKIEKALHNFFKPYHKNNEWFELSLTEELKFFDMCSSIEKNLIYIEKNKC
jgi:transposase-like protein